MPQHCIVSILGIPHNLGALDAIGGWMRHVVDLAAIKDDAVVGPCHEIWTAVEGNATAYPAWIMLDGGAIPNDDRWTVDACAC